VEGRAGSPDEVRALLAAVPAEWDRFVELPLDQDLAPLIAILAEQGAGAKFRTGGVTADGFPASEALLSGLAAVVLEGIPFKCTAGLHHPVRGRYPLTYQPDGPSGMMYGYLNVFLTAALLWAGHPVATVRPVLLEEDPAAFRADQEVLGWRDLVLDRNQLAEFRRSGLQGFGSCSFREPVDELLTVFSDLRDVGCDILTVGQYLQPTREHLPVVRYYPPEEFAALRERAVALGFAHVEAGPLVRSSYHAEEQAAIDEASHG